MYLSGRNACMFAALFGSFVKVCIKNNLSLHFVSSMDYSSEDMGDHVMPDSCEVMPDHITPDRSEVTPDHTMPDSSDVMPKNVIPEEDTW